ncbi:putative ribonuclease H-like domain-containing protein, partial [Tanacetum coccineum]
GFFAAATGGVGCLCDRYEMRFFESKETWGKETCEGKNNKGQFPITVHESPTDNSAPIQSGPTSYAKLVTGESSRKSLNLCTLIAQVGNEAGVAIPLESIRAISERFATTAYGFFLGKRVAYPVVANYVRNTSSIYELVKSMLKSSNSLSFFHINSEDGLEAMLENGPWFIRNNSFILKKLESKGTPMMLDSYTSDMCIQSWGRSSYARAMIEVRPDEELKDTVMVVMPKLVGKLPFVDDDGKPLSKVVCTVNADRDSEVEEVSMNTQVLRHQ